jgi:hypothetical protein
MGFIGLEDHELLEFFPVFSVRSSIFPHRVANYRRTS